MKLSRKSEYALLALVDLAQHFGDGFIPTAGISERKDVPRKYLEQILLTLKRSGHVKSIRGAEGGYQLAKSPAEITLAEVIRLMDGALAPVECVSKHFYAPTPIETQPKLLTIFRDIRNYTAAKLEKATLADVA